MTTLAGRRWRNVTLLVLISALVLALARVDADHLGHTNFLTGWLLLGLMLVLTALNLRKKLPMLRLGRASTWLQVHIYLGLLSAVVFLAHLDFRLPNGYLELGLAILYVLVAGGGVLGLWLSRRLPPRLTRRGENVLYERIPAFRTRLREEVEAMVQRAAEEHGSVTLPALYTDHLRPFMLGPRHFWQHLAESRRPYHRLAGEMAAAERYLSPAERDILADIADRVRTKDDLDYQHAGQAMLKRWLLLHIPLTYALLLFAAAHALAVYAFIGGL
jgi:hypothetical protein